jgi:hypothetical protein
MYLASPFIKMSIYLFYYSFKFFHIKYPMDIFIFKRGMIDVKSWVIERGISLNLIYFPIKIIIINLNNFLKILFF